MKKILVIILSVAIMMSCLSVNVFADELDGEDDSIYENRLRFTFVQTVDADLEINSSGKASWNADIAAPTLKGGVFDLIARLQKYNSSTGKYVIYEEWIKVLSPATTGVALWSGSKAGVPSGQYRMRCVFGVGKGRDYENVVRYSGVVYR